MYAHILNMPAAFPHSWMQMKKMGGHWQICCTAGVTGATEECKVNAKKLDFHLYLLLV